MIDIKEIQVFSTRRNEQITLLETITKVEGMVTENSLVEFRRGIGDVTQWIDRKGFNTIVVTGKSGFLSKRLLEGVGRRGILWFKDHNSDVYSNGNLSYLSQFLIEQGRALSQSGLVIVDDYMGLGRFKARGYLVALKDGGYKNFGFAAIIGPTIYHKLDSMSIEAMKQKIFLEGDDERLKDCVFFPHRKNIQAQNLMYELEKLADYYKYPQVQNFMDGVLERIVKVRMS